MQNYAWEPPGDDRLGERDRAILAIERRWWRHAGAKEEAIRRGLGLDPTAYYQRITRLVDDPAALAFDPVLVTRLRRQRAARRRPRASRTLGGQRQQQGT